MKGYNGRKNWAQWNVALWIGNDEYLYRLAQRCIRRSHTRNDAACLMLAELHQGSLAETPDGAKYSVTAIRNAMVGM